jgi:hypothetical protein
MEIGIYSLISCWLFKILKTIKVSRFVVSRPQLPLNPVWTAWYHANLVEPELMEGVHSASTPAFSPSDSVSNDPSGNDSRSR